jgi:hypothetical protein
VYGNAAVELSHFSRRRDVEPLVALGLLSDPAGAGRLSDQSVAASVSQGIDHRTFVTAVRTVVLRSGARRKCPTLIGQPPVSDERRWRHD